MSYAEKVNKRVLLLIIIAGGFDSFGDNGNAFARNTVFTNRYM